METQNSVPPEFTGMTTAIGGANQWSCYGGARLILGNTDIGGYVNFDLTQATKEHPTIIKFSTDLSKLICGIVAAFYMVPMESVNNNDYSGTLYSDAQSIGLKQSGAQGLISRLGRTEIDLLEASSRSAQTTLHGYNQTQLGQQKWNNGLDQNGIWHNANVNPLNGNYKQVFGNSNEDNGDLTIDTTKPIDVTCTINSTQVSPNLFKDGKIYYTINLKTEISQDNGKSITLNVDSSQPNTKLQQNTITYFSKEELQKMCFIYSLWTDYDSTSSSCEGQPLYHTPTKWLDGDLGGSSKGHQRGPCKDPHYAETTKMQCNINKNNPNNCKNDNTYYNYIYNITFNTIRSNLGAYVWILDYMYRGINDASDNTYNPGTSSDPSKPKKKNWVGRYNYSYLNCQVNPSDTPLKSTQIKPIIPSFSPNDIELCNNIYSKASMSQYQTLPDQCDFSNSNEDCNFIKTNLVSYDEPLPPSPPPPSPPPPSPTPPHHGPSPSSKSNNNNKTLAYVSLSMSIVTIILLILMTFIKL